MSNPNRAEIEREVARLRKEALQHGFTADEENRIADQLEKEADELEETLQDEDEE